MISLRVLSIYVRAFNDQLEGEKLLITDLVSGWSVIVAKFHIQSFASVS